jgi:hypothetical protein
MLNKGTDVHWTWSQGEIHKMLNELGVLYACFTNPRDKFALEFLVQLEGERNLALFARRRFTHIALHVAESDRREPAVVSQSELPVSTNSGIQPRGTIGWLFTTRAQCRWSSWNA